MNMGLEAHVKEEDAKNRRNLKLFLDRAADMLSGIGSSLSGKGNSRDGKGVLTNERKTLKSG